VFGYGGGPTYYTTSYYSQGIIGKNGSGVSYSAFAASGVLLANYTNTNAANPLYMNGSALLQAITSNAGGSQINPSFNVNSVCTDASNGYYELLQVGGYSPVANAVTALKVQLSAGNFVQGKLSLYGISS
jgi:hypothetical protein